MAAKITRDVLESYLRCKTKAHLRLAGQQGNVSDYEALLLADRQDVRQQAIGKILSKHPEGEVARDICMTAAALRAAPSFVFNATLEDDHVSLRFDGLKKVGGPSALGDFHFIPMLFHEGRKVSKEQRLMLEVDGLLLSQIQGRLPAFGIVWHGREVKATKVRLNPDVRRAGRLLREAKEMAGDGSQPKLLLNAHCRMCEFRCSCHDRAVQEDSISLLGGVGEKEIKRYARKGILTLTQLAHTFRPRRKGKRQVQALNHRYYALQALAIRDKKVYIFGTPQLPASPVRIYLDMEGDTEEAYVYLIGMIVVQGGIETRHSFWAADEGQESRIFEEFLAEVGRYQDFLVFVYGGYERSALMRVRKRIQRRETLDGVLKAMVNILSLIYAHIYFPTHSNGLKDVAARLGYSWTEPNPSGLQSLYWRRQWETTRDERWKRMLETYNAEDCEALRRVTEFLDSIEARSDSTTGPQPSNGFEPAVAHVEEIDRLGTVNWRGRSDYFHDDFGHITKLAHFDYQRKRVYARSVRAPKRDQAKLRGPRNGVLRASRRVQVVSRKCPSCGSADLRRWTKGGKVVPSLVKKRRAFDLVLTAAGIKRRVIDFSSSTHECLACGWEFVPERYRRLAKHFHGLMSWAMYHQVVHRISPNGLERMLIDLFGLAICQQEINEFKTIMASYYRSTYRGLLKKILSSTVLHIDETEVKLRTGKGFVWVFTSRDDVYYMYKPTREGDFLRELLKGYRGVLVSDFYSAYDSHDCPQQKCLIHLIRDMNDDLLQNPFDEELQSITAPFGALLRAIVTTIDEHGLRSRHLRKHKREVEEFFRSQGSRTFRSEPAEALQTRLMKNREKLFTFIEHDGVSWHNNNAENAIRQFAYYREEVAGHLTEDGLRDYLVLLSIYQTCRYREVSFLKFLLSKGRDIDAFCRRPNRRRRSPIVEVYPKGVERPDFRKRPRAKSELISEQGKDQVVET